LRLRETGNGGWVPLPRVWPRCKTRGGWRRGLCRVELREAAAADRSDRPDL